MRREESVYSVFENFDQDDHALHGGGRDEIAARQCEHFGLDDLDQNGDVVSSIYQRLLAIKAKSKEPHLNDALNVVQLFQDYRHVVRSDLNR